MMDIGFSDLKIVLMILAILAPGFLVGALVGGVGWHVAVGTRWWAGAASGALAGTAVWFAWMRYH